MIPHHKTNIGAATIKINGAKIWNNLDANIKQISNIKEEPITTASVITCISNSLEMHCNTRIDLNHETYQAKLIAIRPTIPSTLPLSIGILPKQKILVKSAQKSTISPVHTQSDKIKA